MMKQKMDKYRSPLIRLKGNTVKVAVAIADSVNFYAGVLSETVGNQYYSEFQQR